MRIEEILEQSMEKKDQEDVFESKLWIPRFLYHATYGPVLNSIRANGIDSKVGRLNYNNSLRGVVYLAIDPDVAESYAEVSETVSDDWLDEIVILKIDTTTLHSEKFHPDRNVRNFNGQTLEYHGAIPYSSVVRVSKI